MPKKKSLTEARPHVKENKDTSQLPKVEDVVKKLLHSKRLISHLSYQYKIGGTIIESHHIVIERIRCSSKA